MAEELATYEQGPGDPDPLGLDKKLRQLQSTKAASSDPLGLEAKLRATQQQPKPAPAAFKPMTDWLAMPEAAQPMVYENAINDHNTKVAQAKERVNAHLGDIDNSVHNLIHEHKQDLQGRIVSEQLGLNPKEVGPINPQAQQLESQLRQGITVAPKEISDFKTGMATDPAMARMALNQKAKDLAKKDPNAAKQLKGDLYRIDRQNDPSKDNKISENIDKINSGEYDYDITHGQLVKPQGFFGSLVTGYKEKVDAFDDYDVYKTGDKDAILKRINERTKYDPDKAIPVSEEGWLSHPLGEMGRAFGGLPLKPLIAGAIAGRLGPQAGAAATAAVSVPEMYKLTFGSALPHNYDALKKQNPTLSEEEVLQKAIDLTDKQANTDAAVAGAMGGLGAKAGFEPTGLKNTLLQKSLRSALGQIGQEGLKKTIEGLGVGAIGAGGQYIKNVMAQKAGIPTDETEGMAQQLWSGVGMTMMMTIAAKTPELLKPKTYNQFFQAVKDVPTETIQHHLDNLKEAGQITEEQAQTFNKSLEEHKALDNSIKTHVPESDRLKVQELIKERDQLKAGLETEDEAYRSETNEKIKALNERINNVSKGQDRGELQQFVDEAFKNEDIKRSTTDDFRNASENDLKKHFKEIARLAHDPNTEAGMRDTFGDDIVNKAKELYPQEPPKESKISVIQPGEIKQPETITIAPKEEIKPVSENIQPNKEFQTMNMGKDEGQPETKEAREQMKARMVQGDVPIDGEGGKGETGRGFAGRVLSAWENLKKSGDHNTSLITHSSVLKAIKTWENAKTWEGIEKPTDPTQMNSEQWKRFADEFNKERTENGDLETFKGDKGDIHVIRHGQTEDNKMNKFRSGNTNLTEEGIQQAHDVGKKLQEKTGGNVPQIITSDLPRAVHTSNIIHENLKPTENAETIRSNQGEVLGTGDVTGQRPDARSENIQQPASEEPINGETQQQAGIGSPKEEGNAPSQEKVVPYPGAMDLPFGEDIGIAHEYRSQRAFNTGEEAPMRGEVLEPEQYIERGKELIAQGIDPHQVANDFKNNGKIGVDDISVVRAEYNRLARETNRAADQFGINSPEDRAARSAESKWYNDVVKPMQTAWGAMGREQQGVTDIDTGTFSGIRRYFEQRNEQPMSKAQEEHAKELAEKVSGLTKEVEELKKKLTDAVDKSASTKETAKTIKENADKFADLIRKGKTRKPGSFQAATPGSLVWDGALEIMAKTVEAGGTIVQAISDGISHIKQSDWYRSLSEDEQRNAEYDFNKYFENENDLFTRFTDKKDNKFSTEDVRDIWDYAKTEYINKGKDFNDMVYGVSKDLGLSPEQVRNAITQPKGAKAISDELYKKQYHQRQAIQQAKAWVKSANTPKLVKALKFIPHLFFRLKTFGHGTVGGVTHAGMNIFRPSAWRSYWPSFFKQFKFAFGKAADYEKAMQDLVNDPEFIKWKRAALAVDPAEKFDDYQTFDKMLGRLGAAGDRGFNALKVMRLEMAKAEHDRLSAVEKSNPEVLKEIATIVNHATGTSKIPVPEAIGTAFFAPRLEASRWSRLVTQPIKAIATFTNWKNATPAEKAAAKIVAKRSGEIMATYVAALAANQGILMVTGSKQNINFTNPGDPDWLKFKMGDRTLDLSGGMISAIGFISHLVKLSVESEKELKGKKRSDALFIAMMKYGRGKLSPLGSTVSDFATQHDYGGNTMPFSSDKPGAFGHKLTWKEYILNQQTPIPVAEAIKDVTTQMKERGMSSPDINQIMQGIFIGVMSGGTGARIGEDFSVEKKSGSGGGADATGGYSSKKTSKAKHTITHKIHR